MKFKNFESIEKLIDIAINEDFANGDPSTEVSIGQSSVSDFILILKEPGVLSGIDLAEFVFKKFDPRINFDSLVEDKYSEPRVFAKINGPTRSILTAERTVLNFIQRMSGVATTVYEYKKLIQDLDVDITDTRKTIPGWRILDKYSVLVGGGSNHRIDLGEMIMIKDNHLNTGNLEEIVNRSKSNFPKLKIEVEVENEKQLDEVLFLPIDRIMLDNWDPEKASKAVKKIRSKNKDLLIEISGGINKETIRNYALCLPDIISLGSVTHSARALDISLELL
ncbi:MAG: nicotinate-nucleotide diphosphorylase (carboxylating) [Chloroflexi bacterium]|nr:nicotinate-nucleotide diphosphorylase (carboxylating) [Chloroflexota bacterium]|tara:strand:+ start:1034 stop:1870 length:837 start_codon:yes stop_codon:yes gene_type:complete